jgi:transposase
MDNLSPHRSAETLCLIQQLGVEVLFLPAYSPDLNPIEKMWSKLKEFLRSAEARSRYCQKLCTGSGRILGLI